MSNDTKQSSGSKGDGNLSQSSRRGQRGKRSRGGGKRREIVMPHINPETVRRIQAPLADHTFIVFDIETTGGNPEKNGITEIFAIRYRGGEVLGTFYSMVNPGIPIPPIVRRMTGINNQMVRGAPRIEEVMPDFIKFVGGDVFVSHNTIGDMKFVRYFAKQACDVDLDNFYLCTHLLVEKLAPEAPDKSLKGLAEFFRLAKGELHRAEADAYVTLELFKVLLGRLGERSVRRVDEAVRLQGDLESAMRLGWGINPSAFAEVPPGPGVFYLYDHEQRLLFLSSAMHLDREVNKLRAFPQLPRQLLRLVLRSYDLKTKRCTTALSAMLEEGAGLAANKLTFSPLAWHQRSMQTIYVCDENERSADPSLPAKLRIGIGALETGARFAFGPVRDRRIAGELLDALAAAFATVGHKTGQAFMLLPAALEPQLLGFFAGSSSDELRELQRQKRSFKLLFKPTQRRALAERIHLLKRLNEVKLPPRLAALLDRTGVLAVADPESGGWQVHSIAGLRPVAVTSIKGSVDEAVSGAFGAQLAAQLVRHAALVKAQPLAAEHVHQANALLWWLYNCKAESRFFPLIDGRLVAEG